MSEEICAKLLTVPKATTSFIIGAVLGAVIAKNT